jgi:hypothetical protein
MEKMLGKSGFFVTREREREREREKREREMYFILMKLYDIICSCISCTNNIVKRKTHYYYYEVSLRRRYRSPRNALFDAFFNVFRRKAFHRCRIN